MSLIIKRGAARDPGTWVLHRSCWGAPGQRMPDSASVVMWCPTCARPMTLHVWKWRFGQGPDFVRSLEVSTGHFIWPGGTVTPAVDCPHCQRPYDKVGLVLEGWDENALGRNQP